MKTLKLFLITLSFIVPAQSIAQNNSLDFDGQNDQVLCPNGANPSGPFTVEFWMKSPFNGGGGHAAPVSTRFGAGQNGFAFLSYSNNIKFQLGTTSFWQVATANINFVPNQWYHIAGVYDGTNIRIYVDGVLEGSHALTGSYVHVPGNLLRIGRGVNSGVLAFKGTVDEVRVWNSVRTLSEIQGNMNTEISATSPNLKAYYKFNQGDAQGNNTSIISIIDATANGNHGSHYNMAMTGCTSNFICGTPVLGTCIPSGYCNPTWLGTTSTDWNTASNWSDNAVPTAGTSLVTILNVANDPVISTDQQVGNIELETGAILKVASGGTLTLTGTLTNSGSITVQDGGSFLQGASSSISTLGTFRIQRQGGQYYGMWSSPITSQNDIPGTASWIYDSSASTQDDSDDETDPGWVSYNGTMTPGQGYMGFAGHHYTFTGTPNNGNVNLPLYYTPFDNTYTQTTPGTPFNLIGNPYPSAISAANFIGANSDLFGTIYLWNDDGSFDYDRSDYAYWNGTGGLGTGSGPVPNGYIGTGQGFMVRALNGTAVANFTNAQRVAGNNAQFHKASAEDSRMWLSIENDDYYNEILIGLLEDATDDEDRLYDAVKLKGNPNLSLSAVSAGTEYAIMAIPPPLEERTIPLQVELTETGSYFFTPNTMEHFEGYNVYLSDTHTGMNVLLEEGVSVEVAIEAGEYINRFYLNFSPLLVTGIEETTGNELNAWISNDRLFVQLNTEVENATIQLFDMSGKQLFSHQNSNGVEGQMIIPLETTSGIYTVRAITQGEVHTKKIYKN